MNSAVKKSDRMIKSASIVVNSLHLSAVQNAVKLVVPKNSLMAALPAVMQLLPVEEEKVSMVPEAFLDLELHRIKIPLALQITAPETTTAASPSGCTFLL